MVRWCIRLTRLTLVCEVIRYRLVQLQVRQNHKKKRKRYRTCCSLRTSLQLHHDQHQRLRCGRCYARRLGDSRRSAHAKAQAALEPGLRQTSHAIVWPLRPPFLSFSLPPNPRKRPSFVTLQKKNAKMTVETVETVVASAPYAALIGHKLRPLLSDSQSALADCEEDVIQICHLLSQNGKLSLVRLTMSFPTIPNLIGIVNANQNDECFKMWSVMLLCTICPPLTTVLAQCYCSSVCLFLLSIRENLFFLRL